MNIENVVFWTLQVKVQVTSLSLQSQPFGSMCQRGKISEAIEECWKWNDTLSVIVFAGNQL